MIIYFEDGPLNATDITDSDEYIPVVDAALGYSTCQSQLEYIKRNLSFHTKVYTNAMQAFSSYWCWDECKQAPMIYVRNRHREWTHISELTTRKLRVALNLEKLYINGEFSDLSYFPRGLNENDEDDR